jgi:lipase chaperone LimK
MLLCECDHRAGKVVEPALTALLADLPEAKAAVEQRSTAFQPIIAAAKAGDAPHAARLFFDLVNNQGASAFDCQSATFRDMVPPAAK